MFKYSFVICVFDGETTIRECLNSCLNQTIKAEAIIIVDDCSTDNTLTIVSNFANNYQAIRIYHNTKNQGVAYSRNLAISKVPKTSDYIIFNDADDISLLNRAELQISNLIRNNSDLDICSSYILNSDGSFNQLQLDNYKFTAIREITNKLLIGNRLKKRITFSIAASTMTVTRRLIEKIAFDTGFIRNEDADFALQAVKSKFALSLNPEMLIIRRRTTGKHKNIGNEFQSEMNLLEKWGSELKTSEISFLKSWHNLELLYFSGLKRKTFLAAGILSIKHPIKMFFKFDVILKRLLHDFKNLSRN